MIYRVQPVSFLFVSVCVGGCARAPLYILSISETLSLGFGEAILLLHTCTSTLSLTLKPRFQFLTLNLIKRRFALECVW